MKPLKSLFAIALLVSFFSCEFQEEPNDIKEEYSFYITGIKESISYSFHTGTGRVAEKPDEVKNLTVLIVNELGKIVYETRYFEWDYYGVIPDSVFIPALQEGVYNIYAVTMDYYNYWYYEDHYRTDSSDYNADTTYYKSDSANYEGKLVIEPWVVNNGPIYVGSESFVLEQDEQHVVLTMNNISSKITLTASEPIEGWMEIGIESKARGYYDIREGAFVEKDYHNYLYMYLEDSASANNFYVLPQAFKQVNIYFYTFTDNQYTYTPTLTLDPPVVMDVGDAVTFKIDMETLLKGSGSAVFEWEDIEWNDIGEISIP